MFNIFGFFILYADTAYWVAYAKKYRLLFKGVKSKRFGIVSY
jgi:hypothetical protein